MFHAHSLRRTSCCHTTSGRAQACKRVVCVCGVCCINSSPGPHIVQQDCHGTTALSCVSYQRLPQEACLTHTSPSPPPHGVQDATWRSSITRSLQICWPSRSTRASRRSTSSPGCAPFAWASSKAGEQSTGEHHPDKSCSLFILNFRPELPFYWYISLLGRYKY